MIQSIKMVALVSLTIIISACTAPKSLKNESSTSSSMSDGAALVGKVSLVVKGSNNSLVYSDGVVGSALVLKAGQTYDLQLAVENAQPGATYKLERTQTNIVGGPTDSIPLKVGSNVLSIPSNGQGEFSWKLIVSGPNMTPFSKFYLADVQCSSPTFTADSLDASKISVSPGAMNLYSFSAAGVDANANGTGPYTCAWDVTGIGVQDSAFKPCNQALANVYVNYVQNRNIGLLVKDSCFITHSVSKTVNLPASAPSMPGNVFITGVNSGATGAMIGDARVDGVNYLATNSGGNNIVQPMYGGGTFKIYAAQNYGMPSSVNFGMQIEVGGIVDSINLAAATGTVDASAAHINRVTYSTDQAGDQRPPVVLTSMSCTLSNQGAKLTFTQGTPCSAGQTGSNNMAVVEVWGHYSCASASNASGSTAIQGDFDGYYNIADNCVGGGGQGGGGIVPINL